MTKMMMTRVISLIPGEMTQMVMIRMIRMIKGIRTIETKVVRSFQGEADDHREVGQAMEMMEMDQEGLKTVIADSSAE